MGRSSWTRNMIFPACQIDRESLNPLVNGLSRHSPLRLRDFTEAHKLRLEHFKIFVGEMLQSHQTSTSTVHAFDQLVQFQVNGFGVSVLSILDKKHRQVGNH